MPAGDEANQQVEDGLVEIKPGSAESKLIMSFDNLKGSNYTAWSLKMTKGLKYFGLWEYVTGDMDEENHIELGYTTKKQKSIITKNEFKAYLLISSKLEPNVESRTRFCTTAKELWNKLETQHKLKGSKGQTDLIYRWGRIRLREGGSVSEYLAEHDEIKAAADDLNLSLGLTYAALQLLMGLPPSWDTFRQTLETGAADREEELDYDHIQDMILQEDCRRSVTHRVLGKSTTEGKQKPTADDEMAMSAGNKDKTNEICHRCGWQGHLKSDCHTREENFKAAVDKRKANGRQQQQQWNPNNADYPQPSSSSNPYNSRRQPPRDEAKHTVDFAGAYIEGKARRQERHGPSKAKPVRSVSSLPKRSLNLTDVDYALSANACKGDLSFLLDSGASNHTCGERSFFSDIRSTYAQIGTAENKNVHVVREMGTIAWESEVDGIKRVFSLSDVYYIPDFCNLISVGQLRTKGGKVTFTEKGADLIASNGVTFAHALDYKRNLYRMDAKVIHLDQANAVSRGTSGADKAMIWHRRLGHASAGYLDTLRQHGIITDISKEDIEEALSKSCVTCTKGKRSREPFPDSPNMASQPLALLHSDLAGPMQTRTTGGSKYWLTIIDNHTRFLWTYTLRSKSEVPEVILDGIKMAERQAGAKVKRFRTDNGGEYAKLDAKFPGRRHSSRNDSGRYTTTEWSSRENEPYIGRKDHLHAYRLRITCSILG